MASRLKVGDSRAARAFTFRAGWFSSQATFSHLLVNQIHGPCHPKFPRAACFRGCRPPRQLRAASLELHISASAISHQVRSLEDHFGRALFEPGSRTKRLTDDGARLAAGLADALDAIETACAEVTPRATASTLTVHCAPSFAAKWLAPRLPGFMERYPAISIRLSSGAGVYDLIRNEATDVAIVYGDMPASPGVTLEPLGEEQISAVCAPAMAAMLPAVARRGAWGCRSSKRRSARCAGRIGSPSTGWAGIRRCRPRASIARHW